MLNNIDIELIDLVSLTKTHITDSSNLVKFNNTILTIGIFDGVHFAHELIINTMKDKAKELTLNTALMTFEPHPDYVLGMRSNNGYIQPITDRINKFKELGIDYLFIVKFTKELSNLSYETFYKMYLESFAFFVIGYDFTFGSKALGKSEYLKLMKKDTIIIPEIDYENSKISSTRIRELLQNGKVEDIVPLLDKEYSISGVVRHGSKIGTSLGYPTANIEFSKDNCEIMNGVYAVNIKYKNKILNGICNVGNNPTINYCENKRLEVYIFDFDKDIYDCEITIYFKHFIRSEQKFNSEKELIKQIEADIKKVRELIY